MNAVVAVTVSWGIGKDNGLLFHIPDDLRRFAKLTKQNTVIMGRKTLESLPGGCPLSNRRNIVLTRDLNSFFHPSIDVAHTVEEALTLVSNNDPDSVWVIGGEQVYRSFLSHCNKCYVTKIYSDVPADTFFPDLDADPNWVLTEVGKLQRCRPNKNSDLIRFQFLEYTRVEPDRVE